ncbi:MAG: hypothetical protein HYW09_00965 [Candidatus Niyogibacteria bacterium]|nr:hypothetical protein [Candidatus Niyogibacteria bacterium]
MHNMPQINNRMQDIVPPPNRPVSVIKKENGPAPENKPKNKPALHRAAPPKFIVLAVISYALILVAIGFWAKAEVNLVLRSETLEVDNLLPAAVNDSEILTEKVVFEDKAESSAKTSGLKNFNDRASGIIIIYNAYSSEPQALLSNTRFETVDGKIFRSNKPITVPGAKIIDGKIDPSSIEIKVFADEAGDSYNIGLADFSIPGFKGGVKFDKFYARSKTPMTGGFVGKAGVVSKEDIEILRQNLENELKQKLYARFQSEIPDDFLAPEGAYKYEIEVSDTAPSEGSRADEFKMTLSGALQAFFVRRSDIKNKIAERFKDDPEYKNIDIVNFNELKIEAVGADFGSTQLKLKVSGQAKIVWGVDEERLAGELALASASSRLGIFNKYPQIRKAQIIYRPFWWKIFPDEAAKVVISGSY